MALLSFLIFTPLAYLISSGYLLQSERGVFIKIPVAIFLYVALSFIPTFLSIINESISCGGGTACGMGLASMFVLFLGFELVSTIVVAFLYIFRLSVTVVLEILLPLTLLYITLFILLCVFVAHHWVVDRHTDPFKNYEHIISTTEPIYYFQQNNFTLKSDSPKYLRSMMEIDGQCSVDGSDSTWSKTCQSITPPYRSLLDSYEKNNSLSSLALLENAFNYIPELKYVHPTYIDSYDVDNDGQEEHLFHITTHWSGDASKFAVILLSHNASRILALHEYYSWQSLYGYGNVASDQYFNIVLVGDVIEEMSLLTLLPVGETINIESPISCPISLEENMSYITLFKCYE